MTVNIDSSSDIDLKADAVLDSSIQFEKQGSLKPAPPKTIFLTGATGFLGAFLLDEFLNKTSAVIYCLVRSNSEDNGKLRIKHNLEYYSLWKEEYNSRIIPVIGDLSQPFLGISQSEFNKLAELIDFICHNGAHVNSMYPYTKLKQTNVVGTQEIIRFAATAEIKPVHFISTMAVFFSNAYSQNNRVIFETDIPVADSGLQGGYRQSKWVSEQLIMIAQKRGLPACIYRVARIMGHSQTGITGNLNDFLYSLIKCCVELGKLPSIETLFNLIPVDYVSQAVVHLTQQNALLGKTFHILNPSSISWKNLFDEIRCLGYKFSEVSYDDWVSELKRQHKNKFYLQMRLLLNSPNALFSLKPKFDNSYTIEQLTRASIICPQINAKLFSIYLSYFQKIGYIPVISTYTSLI